jgi:hypothetical protein
MDQSPYLKHSTVLAPEVRLQRYLIGSGAMLLALFLFSFTGGPYPVPVESVVAVFLHRLHLVDKTWSDAVELVVFNSVVRASSPPYWWVRPWRWLVRHTKTCSAIRWSHRPYSACQLGPGSGQR